MWEMSEWSLREGAEERAREGGREGEGGGRQDNVMGVIN